MAEPVNGLEASFTVIRSDRFTLGVDLTIAPKTTVALLGPNGAGKSTTVAAIAGLIPIDSGSVVLDGVPLDVPERGVFVPPEQRRIGVVFQDYLLFSQLSVLENVAFGMRSQGVGRSEARARAGEWLERLGLEGMGERRPGDLSGGQAQRVALARALAPDPDLLLLDEPMSALDVTSRDQLQGVLAAHLDAFPGPRLLITHDPNEAFRLSDQVHIIVDGSITQSGTADEITMRPATRYAADLAGANLYRGMAEAGVVVIGSHSVRIADVDLEGEVALTIRPTAVSLHRDRPEGSQRNTWETLVTHIESSRGRVRARTGPPLPLTVEITESARAEMRLESGHQVWLAVKATEIDAWPVVR